MGTQYQNYKSDFVLRESFVDITGKAVPLPTDVDFTLRYWTKHGREYVASRQGGVYTNCAPEEGGTLLVFFKAHNLCEGELHHELHLALDNPVFEDGTQDVFYPADLHILLWDKASSTDKLTSGLVADYTRGHAFTFDDFTADQIKELQRPAQEAADRYDAAIADYNRKASEQVERVGDVADVLEGLEDDFKADHEKLAKEMTDTTEAAKSALASAEKTAADAAKAAQTATAEAQAAQKRANAAADNANAAQKTAETAAQEAAEAKQAADKATAAANKAKADADKAAQAATSAAGDATSNAQEARTAAHAATAAIKTVGQVTDDARSIAERAEAAAAAANAAKTAADKATAAATKAKADADAATAAATKAKADADAATAAAIAAAQRAEAATQATEQQRAVLYALIDRAQHVTAGVPTGMEVEAPATVTMGNPVKQYVRGRVLPTSALQNVLYLADGKAVDVLPDGEIVPQAIGTSRVHVIPTDGTRFYKTIQVETVAPRIRTTAAGTMRLDKQGNIRLT